LWATSAISRQQKRDFSTRIERLFRCETKRWNRDREELLKSFSFKFAAPALLIALSVMSTHAQDASQPADQTASQPSHSSPDPKAQPAQKPAQDQNTPASAATAQNLPDKVQPAGGADTKNAENPKRILGIIPNFVSANDTSANKGPLTVKEKYILSYHQMFDFSAHLGNLLQSTVSQATDGQPHYGEGWGSFAERFAASEGDQMSSCFFIYGVLPSVLHDDPRYFRRGTGSVGSRLWYAASRTVITRKDSGQPTFNIPQTLGQLIQQGISTSYYPARDRTVSGVFTQWGINLTYNSGYNMLREFMPDLGQYLANRKKKKAAAQSAAASSAPAAQSN
jgi:hypothetical protein